MSSRRLPLSFYLTLVTFGVFFACLNIYILTAILNHPWASPLWLVGVLIGLAGLIYSAVLVRRDQRRLVSEKSASAPESESGC